LAFCHISVFDYAEAITQLVEAVRIAPEHAAACYWFGYSLNRLERYEDAVTQLCSALRAAPGYAQAHCEIGRSYMAVGRVQDALASWHKVVDLDHTGSPTKLEAQRFLAQYVAVDIDTTQLLRVGATDEADGKS
jgi:tetratricopeptide (TPR) repeat protein